MLTASRKARLGLTTFKAATLRAHYHDESFGYRRSRPYSLPDYTPDQLENRAKNAALLRYVESVRQHGHRAASIDPLDLLERDGVNALDPKRYGLTDSNAKFNINGIIWHDLESLGNPSSKEVLWSLSEIVNHLRSTYVGRIAYEYMHSPSKAERLWFSHLLESRQTVGRYEPNDEQKRRIWGLLARSETWDHFLQLKFPNLKRYGLEGAESMLAALDSLFHSAGTSGVSNVVLCMPHRGRLSLLTDLLGYSPAAMFHKIRGGSEVPDHLGATGDVISHLVSCPTLEYPDASTPVKVTMLQNPSHLEAVNPVAMGQARARQYSLIKESGSDCMLGDKVMCVQLHGDAAFTGQGVIMEGLGLSNLPHYTSGGSVHLVVNKDIFLANSAVSPHTLRSIGYTTPASNARSTLYCSDIGKMINAPVLHVNGDHPEDVHRALKIAFEYRNFFRKILSHIGDGMFLYSNAFIQVYAEQISRGHNELDEPSFTQPLMYHRIRTRQSVPTIYEQKLINEGILSEGDAAAGRFAYKQHLEKELAKADNYQPAADMLGGKWSGMVWPGDSSKALHNPKTGVKAETLVEVGKKSVSVPVGFETHPRLQRHIKHRLSSLESGQGIDWGTAEALAWGSLMLEGYDVRISGQDVGRGTFSHRHAMLVDQKTERVTVPLNMLETEKKLELANSSLSEMAILGFEYGLSWDSPDRLVIWEAQFGDFFNGSQVIIDAFISSAEDMRSGLVMLLPHGLDGAGPEHSSSRIERFLQLTNDAYAFDPNLNINMHVVNATTPAQYFHLLRRQMLRNYRKPLIVASPKGLLRSPAAACTLADVDIGTEFQPVLADPVMAPGCTVDRILLVSGKIYYDLVRERKARGVENNMAIVRIEEIAPFPFTVLEEILQGYTTSRTEVIWVQEEARNQGAWTHVEGRINEVLKKYNDGQRVRYVGRRESPVPAVGVGSWHKAESASLFNEVFA
ncbi:Dehydrogenase E1 and transketolase domain containing 1 [Ceratobasidium theobromae]|uniref:Dehydrogenase E1 and transketolase domain containing 1 n=1 Tax=Ceratobasidium theobromae TaxID=1582974 RepID=A0A5N5QRJ5_9AGAM|nr:Dehydrogenase E1 and transketolase domain containing 1 [Ceratobasidium theobromae]